MMSDLAPMRVRREEIVRRHVQAEEAADVEATLATFAPGRASYDGEALGGEIIGEDAVRDLLRVMLSALSDLHIETENLYHADDAVIAEVRISATHSSEFDGIPPTGRRVSYRLCGIFHFDGDQLWRETVYFDKDWIKRQMLDASQD